MDEASLLTNLLLKQTKKRPKNNNTANVLMLLKTQTHTYTDTEAVWSGASKLLPG